MKKLLIIILSIASIHVYANTIDTTYFRNSFDHAVGLFNVNQDSAMIELKRIEQECKDLNYETGLAECYGQMGLLLKQIGDFPKSLEHFNQALAIYKELNIEKNIAAMYLSIGAVYVHLCAYQLAKEYIHKSLEYFENTDNHFVLAGAYMTISGIHINLEDYDLALEYVNKAIDEYKKADNKWGICACTMNKAIILYEQKKYQECIHDLQQVIELAEPINAHNLIATSVVYIGSSYLEINNLEKAEEYLFKTLGLPNVNSQVLMECYLFIGDLYKAKNDYENAIKYTQKVIDESRKISLIGNEQKAYDRLATYYAELGEYKKAYDLKEISYNLRDTVLDTEKTAEIQRLEAVYQAEKKQQKIENLESENQIQKLKIQKTQYTFIGIIVVLILSLGSIILFVRNSRLKVKNENVLLEQRLLRSQMNPHFIFNAISAIQHYIVKNRSLEASSYLSSFAKLMRSILQNSKAEFVSLDTEFQTLEDYLNLQKLRLDGNLDYKIEGKETLDSEDLVIPPMLIQPFIENAIEHGILKKENQKGKVNISFKEEKNNLFVEIVDDGIGREKAKQNETKGHQSFATEITKSRIKSMKQSYKKGISFDIIDLKNNENIPIGTKVIFRLPLLSA